METNEPKICRLCLKITRQDFQAVEEVTHEMLSILLLSIDFSLTKTPVICLSCADCLQKFFKFKTVCLHTEDQIIPFSKTINGSKINILEVAYMKDNINNVNTEGTTICRFCMQHSESDSYIALDSLEQDFEKNIIAKCIPEINLTLTEKPMICTICIESLMGYYSFMACCFEVEKNISDYCRSQGISDSQAVKLDSVQRFVIINTLGYDEIDETGNSMTEVKVEHADNTELTIKEEEIDIEMEQESFERTSNPISQWKQDSPPVLSKKKKRKKKKGTEIFTCRFCTYETKYKYRFKRHAVCHKACSEIEMYACDTCHQQFRTKCNLRSHKNRSHSDPSKFTKYKCDKCSYTSTQKEYLRTHALTHAKPSESELFKCDKCSFITIRKSSIRAHVQVHMDRFKIGIFKCIECSFTSMSKSKLTLHSIVHAKESQLFKCYSCVFQTRWKESLRQHIMRAHMHAKENTPIFKCNSCQYETKYKKGLIRHLNVHKPSEKSSFKCDKCPYMARERRTLKIHACTHKDLPSNKFRSDTLPVLEEVYRQLYECAMCGFKAKEKDTLKRHIIFKHEINRINRALLEPLAV